MKLRQGFQHWLLEYEPYMHQSPVSTDQLTCTEKILSGASITDVSPPRHGPQSVTRSRLTTGSTWAAWAHEK